MSKFKKRRGGGWRSWWASWREPEPRRRSTRPRLTAESLEERRLFVVGAWDLPTQVVPGGSMDGIVHLASDTASMPTEPRCSGTLLDSGRHILTAAHCVWQNETQVVSISNARGGSFTLSLNGQETEAIAFDASDDDVEEALEAAFGQNVKVKGGPVDDGPTQWEIEFRGDWKLTDVPTLTADGRQLVGGQIVVNPPDSDASDGTPRVGNVRFDLPTGPITFDPGEFDPDRHFVHPRWNGLYFAGDAEDDEGWAGEDIAILTLPAVAPLGAVRASAYTSQDEVEQLFLVTGYGRTGVGATGEVSEPLDTAGVKRIGLNVFSNVDPFSGLLVADFDDGTKEHSTADDSLGLGPVEAAVARGDSGGPALFQSLDVNLNVHLQAVGINSAVDGAGLDGFSAFGDRNYFTRVSDYTLHRDPQFDIHDLIYAPDHIVVDMNLQPDGNDGQADLLEVQTGNGLLSVLLNGRLLWSAPPERALSLQLLGSKDNDVIDASALPADIPLTIDGRDGDDILLGGSGPDLLRGGEGNDQINGLAGHDLIRGGDGHDVLRGGLGNDTLDGEAGDDTLSGHEGADTLIGGLGSDTEYGGPDNDTLYGGLFTQNLDEAPAPADKDVLYGEEGNDYLRGDNFYVYSISMTNQLGGDDQLYGGPGYDTLDGQAGNDLLEGNGDPDVLYGGRGDDTLDGGDREDLLHGQDGDDLLLGGAADDYLSGGLGADTLRGGDGNDQLIGGNTPDLPADSSADQLFGELGNDRLAGDDASFAPMVLNGLLGAADLLDGGDGDDRLYGQGGDDVLHGGRGNDLIEAGAGADQVFAGAGNDSVRGDQGRDRVDGGEGNDELYGGADDDELIGGAGHDLLLGEAGNDVLFGLAGRDLLIGGTGADTLRGGADDDLLIGGTTSFDGDAASLQALAAEWRSPRSYTRRVQNLRGIANPTFAQRQNGLNFLTKQLTVFNDNSVDALFGESGNDFFFRESLVDTVSFAKGETVL